MFIVDFQYRAILIIYPSPLFSPTLSHKLKYLSIKRCELLDNISTYLQATAEGTKLVVIP